MFIMKNRLHFFHLAIAVVAIAFLATSCGSERVYTRINKNSYTNPSSCDIQTRVIADLDISSKRISYTYTVPKKDEKSQFEYLKQDCVREALAANDSSDVLVDPRFFINYNEKRYGGYNNDTYLESLENYTITVTGFPAKYKNIRSDAENSGYSNNNTAESVKASTIINTTNPNNTQNVNPNTINPYSILFGGSRR